MDGNPPPYEESRGQSNALVRCRHVVAVWMSCNLEYFSRYPAELRPVNDECG